MAGKQQAKKSESTMTAAEDNKLYWPIEKLHEWQDNPRGVKPEDFDRLKKQIAELGEYKPLIITPDGEVIGGNMRFKAYTELGKKKVWVSIVNPKDEKDKLKYALSDNDSVGFYVKDYMISLITPFKEDTSFLGEFKVNFDVGDDLNSLLKDLESKEEVEVEPDDAEPESKLGEVYQLGPSRVMCGDSTDWETVSTLMDGKRADISFTSPPYNAGKTPTEEKMGISGKYENDEDDRSDEDYLSLLNTSTLVSLEFSDFSFVNLQSIAGNKIPLIDFLHQMKEKYCDTIIWDKINSQPAMASNVLNSEFEYVHVFSDKATRAIGTKEFRGTLKNIVHIGKQSDNDVENHHATFPIDFAKHFLFNFCRSNGSVLDLFGGSGTTLIAAEQLNLTCFMMELDCRYTDVIRRRWWKFVNHGDEKGWQENTPVVLS